MNFLCDIPISVYIRVPYQLLSCLSVYSLQLHSVFPMSYCKEICLSVSIAPYTCQLVSANISNQQLFLFLPENHFSYLPACLCQCPPSASFQAISANVPHQQPSRLSLPVSPISYHPACLCQCPPSATFQTISATVPHQLPSSLSLLMSPMCYLPGCLCQCPPSATCQPVSASVPHRLPSRLSLPVSCISYLPVCLCQCPPSATF